MLDFFPRLLTIILTLFFLMICGYICRKTKIIDDKASKALSRLIVSIGQPMMIIGALTYSFVPPGLPGISPRP